MSFATASHTVLFISLNKLAISRILTFFSTLREKLKMELILKRTNEKAKQVQGLVFRYRFQQVQLEKSKKSITVSIL